MTKRLPPASVFLPDLPQVSAQDWEQLEAIGKVQLSPDARQRLTEAIAQHRELAAVDASAVPPERIKADLRKLRNAAATLVIALDRLGEDGGAAGGYLLGRIAMRRIAARRPSFPIEDFGRRDLDDLQRRAAALESHAAIALADPPRLKNQGSLDSTLLVAALKELKLAGAGDGYTDHALGFITWVYEKAGDHLHSKEALFQAIKRISKRTNRGVVQKSENSR